MKALDFAGAVGKIVRVERPATRKEMEAGEPSTVGGEGLLVFAHDSKHGGVEIMWDYGMGFTLRDGEMWSISIIDPTFDKEQGSMRRPW